MFCLCLTTNNYHIFFSYPSLTFFLDLVLFVEYMSTLSNLQGQAIAAAEKQDWQAAIAANESLLMLEPKNVSAMNRLGFCYLQKGELKDAKTAYTKVLEIDAYNSIAKKYLDILANGKKIAPVTSNTFQENFIEEPGKTKTVSLCRVADPSILTTISVGTPCTLVVKQHRISVETEQGSIYVGSLPDDLSHNLSKLITGGNLYKTVIKSITKTGCSVFIKELSRSKKQQHHHSFPPAHTKSVGGMHEELLVDSSPIDVTETGVEREIVEDFTEDFGEEVA